MKIGDKVVCVDNGPCEVCGKPVGTKKGRRYVINKLAIHIRVGGVQQLFIGLKGSPACACPDDGTHPASDFRPLEHIQEINKLKQQIREVV